MRGILPDATLSLTERDARPACEWAMPAFISKRDYARTCKVLPPGMPDCLEVSVVHSLEGVERCTAAMYGPRAYLIHYEFKPNRGG